MINKSSQATAQRELLETRKLADGDNSGMSQSSDLLLEACASLPARTIYLEEGFVSIEFKNNSDTALEIVKVSVQFQTERELTPYEVSVSPMMQLRAQNHSPMIRVPFVVSLSLIEATNSYSIRVSYRRSGSSQLLNQSYDSAKSLTIHPIPRPQRTCFFVSHKDPEDTRPASRLDYYLRKVGFEGYVAENDKQPGARLWDKLKREINDALALVVLWTSSAQSDSGVMKKEIDYASSIDKPIVLFSEQEDVPDWFPKKILEFTRTKMDESDCAEMARLIERAYRAGVYD